MLNGELISYTSKIQPIVALLSTEVEYITLGLVAQKGTWLWLLLTKLELLIFNGQFAKIYVDKYNKCAITILSPNLINHIPNQSQISFFHQNLSFIESKNDNQSLITLIKNPILHT